MIRAFITVLLIPVFCLAFGQSDVADLPTILETNKSKFQLAASDFEEYAIADTYTTKQLGVTHFYLVQKYKDISLHNGILNLNVRNNTLLSFGNRWVADLAGKAPSNAPTISAASAVVLAGDHLSQTITNLIEISSEKNNLNQDIRFLFEPGAISRETISAQLIWLSGTEKSVKLCWVVRIYETNQENIWNIFIDAHSGQFIRKDNEVVHCSFGVNKKNIDHTNHKCIVESPAFFLAEDSSYTVFPLTIESPNHGSRISVVTPWSAAGAGNPATTLNWHDDGPTNYTSTRGNNVHAYEDIDANNSPGYSPDTADLRFDYPFDPLLHPEENQAAAITNLFYWNNIIHDVLYQYGFDEVSGNFQNDNLGRGGLGVDYVRAEGLDGGGTNNANFFTPSDGLNPRMQMYLWSAIATNTPLTINAPESIAGEMWAIESAFSTNNKLQDIGLTTGNLVLVEDAIGNGHLACGELSNALIISGNIAVIDRGDCNFTIKVKKVQDLGAIAAIVINDVAGAPIPMGGTDNLIVIPAVMVSLADGNLLKAVLDTSTINASLDSVPEGIIPDGDYDSGIIAHEYGHGVSNRLTGGPSSVNCLNNEEQMGEGWSDYFGLMFTTDWSTAEPADRRGIGTYVLGEPTDGDGIRTYPYTTDMEINPFTYADVADAPGSSNNPSPHFVGSVWNTMLWDMTWEIIALTGVDTDIYDGTGGNNIALSLVMNGLKLQPCNPGFVDGRDAILLADEILYNGLYKCAIWKAFANRGLGVDADQGSSDNYEDGVESFATPDGIRLESSALTPFATEGQEVTFVVRTICGCTTQTDIEVHDKLSEDLVYIPGSGGTLIGDVVEFTVDTLFVQDTLEFTYRAFVGACTATDTLELNQDDAEEPDQYTSIKLAGTGILEWVKSLTQFVSPTKSWYAEDYDKLADYALTLNFPMNTSGPIEVSFQHRYETEANYDGGVVEYTLDGGITWQDAGTHFVQGGYPSSINTGGTDSPIAGRDAFTGNSDVQFNTNGFVHSKIQICSDIDDSFQLRFRFVADGGVGGTGINGWYIDDIYIRQLSGVVNKTTVATENNIVDSLVYCLRTSPFMGSTVYVDGYATGNNSGTNWSSAMRYLHMALAVANCRNVDSVFLAEGNYLPNLDDDRTRGFIIPDSTAVYGGFPEGGSSFLMRDPSTYISLLSGDVGVVNDSSDNIYHLLKVTSEQGGILLDGVTMSYGNASEAGDDGKGAAIFNEGELILDNVIMNNNLGRFDGQIIFNSSETAIFKLIDCLIYGPNDALVKLLNNDAGRLFIEGSTQIINQ